MDRQQGTSLGFDWGSYIADNKSSAAPVSLFAHAPMSNHWQEIIEGMKVEVLNLDCQLNAKVFWIAQVVQVAGYKAKLRYEGFGEDSSCDVWCNLCTLDVHAVGWCATIGKPLVPPQTIQYKYSNWKSFLIKRLTGAKTLPNDFQKRVVESMECPFQCNMRLEVIDKTQISRMRIGIIDDVIGGRLRLRYEDSDDVNDDFWCHYQSPLIHYVGWCERFGHRILVSSKDYKNKKGSKNVRQDLFSAVRSVKTCGFKAGMKLEAIDPLNLSTVCVATVKKVLKGGFLMIGIDGSEAINGSDWFCYHCTAPSIFPVGFCQANNIKLSVPVAYNQNFKWATYLDETKSQAAPVHLFESTVPNHDFEPGMKLEAVDLMEPRLICVATVCRIVGRLLRVHFDGWEDEYDQWVDCKSTDIYPVGWCELVGYDLQPPNTQTQMTTTKKKKLKGQTLGLKKKKKRPVLLSKKAHPAAPPTTEPPSDATQDPNSPSSSADSAPVDKEPKDVPTPNDAEEKKEEEAIEENDEPEKEEVQPMAVDPDPKLEDNNEEEKELESKTEESTTPEEN